MYYSANSKAMEYKVTIDSRGPRNVLEMSTWNKEQGLTMGTDYTWKWDGNDVFERVNFYFVDENCANWFKIRWS
jgi:hypothetical protein